MVDLVTMVRADLAFGQMLAGRTGVSIVLGIVDEVGTGEEAALWVADVCVFGITGRMPVPSQASTSSPLS